jgi:hypothetical protein
MSSFVHVPLASGWGGFRKAGLAAALAGLGLLSATSAQAQAPVIYGIGTLTQNVTSTDNVNITAGTQGLVLIDPATGEAISPTGTTISFATGLTNPFTGLPILATAPAPTPISGVTMGKIVGSDYRPNTGEFFVLGYDADPAVTGNNAQLYTLDTSTGAAAPVGAAMRLELGATDRIGFDFNPTVDRIRITSALTQTNYRVNPSTGTALPDGQLAYNPGNATATPPVPADANSGVTPGIGAVAYLNSYIGSTGTTLLDFDELHNGILSVQNPPNDGVLNTQGLVRFQIVGGNSPGNYAVGSPKSIDFDVYYNPATGANEAYLIEVTQANGQGRSSTNFYSFDLTTRVATQRVTPEGEITVPSVVPFQIHDIAARIAPPTQPALVGRELYALAAGNLVSFDSGNPGIIRSAVSFGAGLTAGQTVVGFDFRPLDGVLYALGYDARVAANNARLYTVNLSTGALTGIGGPITLALGAAGSAIGFDFNPTVDRIRVTSASNRANYRLNPLTGAVVQADGTLTNDVSAVAYTNNDNDVNTGTTLYGYDQTTNFVVRSTDANAGTYVNQGAGSGITVSSAGVDFDIFTDNSGSPATNSGYLVAAPTGTTADNLYTVDLAAGIVASAGRIGLGGNYTALAVPLTPTPINNVFTGVLTWNGSVSSAWNVAANWTPSFVPTATNDVVIPGDTPPNDPTVSEAEQARTVTLTTGAVLTTADGSGLSVSGNFINNGGSVAGSGSGVIALTGAVNQTIGGSSPTSFFNLSVGANGATLGSPAAIRHLLTLNGNLTTADRPLTLLSDDSGQGQVINAAGVVVGEATVQRAIEGSINPENIGYRHFSSPVANTRVSDLNSSTGSGFTAVLTQAYNDPANTSPRTTRPFPNVFGYDQDLIAGSTATDQKFNFDKGFFVPTDAFVANNERAGLQPGRGYTVNIADDVTVDFVGTLNNGPLTVGGLNHSAVEQGGYQFLGNPYPSALDWNTVSRNQIEPSLYVYKSTGKYTGFYSSYNNGASANGGTNVLPVAQGFFVLATPGATNGSVTFNNADRLTGYDNTPFQRGSAAARPELTLALRTDAGRGEQTVIYFEQGATTAYDAAFDANHLAGPGAPLSLSSAGGLSINGLPTLTSGADVVVPLELSAVTSGTYRLQVDALKNLPAGYHAFLRDALTGASTELTAHTSVALPLTAGTAAAGRYAVVFTTQAQVLATAPAALAQLAGVYPNPARGAASLLLPMALRGGKATPVQVVNSLGQVVLSRTLAAGAATVLELPLTNLTPGIYTVRAQTAVGLIVKRLTVQ